MRSLHLKKENGIPMNNEVVIDDLEEIWPKLSWSRDHTCQTPYFIGKGSGIQTKLYKFPDAEHWQIDILFGLDLVRVGVVQGNDPKYLIKVARWEVQSLIGRIGSCI